MLLSAHLHFDYFGIYLFFFRNALQFSFLAHDSLMLLPKKEMASDFMLRPVMIFFNLVLFIVVIEREY